MNTQWLTLVEMWNNIDECAIWVECVSNLVELIMS
jgi:hypothetical protein